MGGRVAERSNAPVLKTGRGRLSFVGSNPTPSAESYAKWALCPRLTG